MRKIANIAIAIAIAVPAAAQAGAPASAPSFKKDVMPLLQRQCVACHMTGDEQGQLGLMPKIAYGSLVKKQSIQAQMARVTPGEPERSYLLHKLRGTHLDQGGSGARMPMGMPELSEQDLAKLTAWIKAGAPDN
jgi:cytochrome c553